MFTPFFFATSYSTSLNHTPSFSFYLLSILNGASLFGRILVGSLADRFGPFNLTVLAATVGTITCYTWTAATSVGELVVWGIFYGFSSGAILSLQMQCAGALAGKEAFGTAVGLAMAGVSFA
jgi:nitrate/nitrite transporter NarK